MPQQWERAEEEDREKPAANAGEPPALEVGQPERNGQQRGVERVDVGDAVAGEIVDEREEEREKIRALVEVVVGGEKDPENVVAARHGRDVAEKVQIEGGGLQDELVVKHLAAERLGGERHEGEHRDDETGEDFFAAVQRQFDAALAPQPPERDDPQREGEQHDVVAETLDENIGGRDRDAEKAEPDRGNGGEPEESEPEIRARRQSRERLD